MWLCREEATNVVRVAVVADIVLTDGPRDTSEGLFQRLSTDFLF